MNSINGLNLNEPEGKLPIDTIYEKNRLIMCNSDKFEISDMELMYEINRHNAQQ